jgi:hypothetical protein
MIQRVDDRLRSEARRYRLRFACPQCIAFDSAAAECAYGFPTAPHRSDDLDARETIAFCKAFELA